VKNIEWFFTWILASFTVYCKYMLNNMKGYNMTIQKDYDVMKNKVDKLLEQIDTLVSDFDEKYDVNLSNDLNYKLDEVSDMIDDNYSDTDFEEVEK